MDEPEPSRIYRIAPLSYRLLTALFMVVIVSGALLWAWNAIRDQRLEDAVSAPHIWPEKELAIKQPSRLYAICGSEPASDPGIDRGQEGEGFAIDHQKYHGAGARNVLSGH